jgi:uncharacterized protein DUF6627
MHKKVIVPVLILLLLFSAPRLFAADHVVSESDLQKALVDSSKEREQNVENLQQLLTNDAVQKAMSKAAIDPHQVQSAIPQLSNQELKELNQRVNRAQSDFAAGNISQRDMLWIIIGVLVLILLIVAID